MGPRKLQTEHTSSIPPAAPQAASSAPLLSLRILALLCIVLPLFVYGVVGAYRYQQIRGETEVRLDRALRIAEEHALKVLETNETVLAHALDALNAQTDTNLRETEQTLHRELRAMSQNKPQIESIRVYGPDGRLLVSDRVYPAPAQQIAELPYFKLHQEAPASGALRLSRPREGRVQGEAVFDMSRARYRPDGSFNGVVAIGVSPSYFAQFHGELGAEERGLAITMLRDDGVIFSRWPYLADAPASLSPNSPVMSRIKAGQTGGVANGVSSVDGRERLLRYNKVGGYPVYLGTGMDVREIHLRWIEEMAWLGAFGLPSLIGLFLASRLALRRTRDALQSAERLQEETLARRRVEEALLQAQKLEALGRLTGGVAHDFNNALMVISNNLFLLKRKHPEADGPQTESIGRAVGSATKLTRQLLAFSRRQALVPEYMQLQERLPGVKDLLGPVLGSQVALQVSAEADTRPILVDSAEFELALINLAINARDAMPSGGKFIVHARNASGPLPPTLEGPMVVVEAADTGTGIPPDVLDKVFEPFFTTKPVGEGTGLGLSQIYGLCQRAGGLATVESQPGLGTTVRLYFPATAIRAADVADKPLSAQRHLGKQILLVEDNHEVAAALQPVLESMGCQVVRLDRGAAARDWLAAQPRLPDLLLTDVVMPGEMDGVALAQHVRRTYPTLRIVVMTGYAEQLESISRLGFDLIPKPCSADMLAEMIGRNATARPAALPV